ncbi:MAG: zinc ribbon domain-containing protein [Deltaproteobacteria bacterium]|nr:zinc ribbon domain-containing protein [Deltaproteobacteria bacterium]
MPLFEYKCVSCDHEFEELVFGDAKVECPECKAGEPRKLMSAHSVGKSSAGASPAPGPCGTCPGQGGGACGLN